MVMTDPIADMLTRIRNANQMRHASVEVRKSKIKKAIADILKTEGFIQDVQETESGTIRLILKYDAQTNQRVITGLKRISKPGLRVYANADNMPRVLNGLGIAVVSTSQGVITSKKARKLGIGGEVVAYIW